MRFRFVFLLFIRQKSAGRCISVALIYCVIVQDKKISFKKIEISLDKTDWLW